MPKFCMFLWDFHSKNRYTGLAEFVKQVEKVPIILKSWRFSQAFRQKKKFWRLDKNWLNYTQISILLESSCKICKIRTSLTSLIKVWKVSSKFDKFWPIFSPLWLILTSFDKFNQNLSSSIKIWQVSLKSLIIVWQVLSKLEEFQPILTKFNQFWHILTNFHKF